MARIEKIQIRNFKSYKKYNLSINHQFKHIIIYGKNGVGKTNLLDSFAFFSNTKGLRGNDLDDIFPINESNVVNTKVKIELSAKNIFYNFIYEIVREDSKLKKKILLDNNNISLLGIKKFINFIWLTPHMDKIMYEGQSLKRNFIDKMISQSDQYFSKSILAYKKNSAERLRVLKSSKDEKWLHILERKVAENIYDIFTLRRKYAEELNNTIDIKLKKFREIKIEFSNNLFTDLTDKNDSINLFVNELKNKRQLDEITKRMNFSINSDRIIFFDQENKMSTDYCSTGEQKSSLLTMILANCWKLKDNDKEFILLLDEAVSHMDNSNFEKLFNEVDKFDTQIWYTGTNKNLFQVIEKKGFFIHLQ